MGAPGTSLACWKLAAAASHANVAEVLRFGIIGWAMSRASGLWVGMKALADTMDSAATVDLADISPTIITPEGFPTDISIRWPDSPLEQERRLFDVRLPAAVAFGRAGVEVTASILPKV